MKKRSKSLKIIGIFAFILCMIFFSACGGNEDDTDKDQPKPEPHKCESVCPVCGG